MTKRYCSKFLLSLAVLVATILLHSPSAQTLDARGRYIVIGTDGHLLCSRLEQDISTYSNALAWVGGYLTAMNYTQTDLYNLAAGTNWTQWMRTYCMANPAHNVDDAVKTLVRVLWPGREVTAPATVVPPAPLSAPRSVPVKGSLRSPQY